MTNAAMKAGSGYQCPVRGCKKKHNRRFGAHGLAQHIIKIHGEDEFIKRLKAKMVYRRG